MAQRTLEEWQQELQWAQDNGEDEYAAQIIAAVPQLAPQAPPSQDQAPQTGTGSPLAVPGEVAAAFNRGIMDTADFFGPGTINAALRLGGVDYQLPTFAGTFQQYAPGAQGGFMGEGMAREAALGLGQALTAVPAMAQVPRNLATAGGAMKELLGFGSQRAPAAAQAAAQASTLSGDISGGPATNMVRRADQLGWPLSTGDRTGSRTAKALESAVESTPMPRNPMHQINDQRQAILRDAAAEAIGLPPGTRLTHDVMGDVAADLSDEFKRLVGLQDMPVDEEFLDQLIAIQNTAKTRLFKDPDLVSKIDGVFDRIDDSGDLKVSDYQDMTSELKQKIRQAWKGESPDPYFAESLSEMVEALDDLAMNNMDPQALSRLKRARAKWRALSTLEKSGAVHESGDVSGLRLANYLRRTDKSGYGRGKNTSDLYEAARLSKAFPSRPDSGTAGRQFINNLLQNPLSGAASLVVSPVTSTISNALVRGPSGARRLAQAASSARPPLLVAGRQMGAEMEEDEYMPY